MMMDCSTQGKGAIYMYARSLGTDVTTSDYARAARNRESTSTVNWTARPWYHIANVIVANLPRRAGDAYVPSVKAIVITVWAAVKFGLNANLTAAFFIAYSHSL